MSESGAFEVCYNVFAEPRAPMFFAVWKHAPIKTTLLRDLGEVCDVTYREFEHPEELRADLGHFFRRITKPATTAPVSLAGNPIWRTKTVHTDHGGLPRHDLTAAGQQVERKPVLGRVDAHW
jgi:hypothetical protein